MRIRPTNQVNRETDKSSRYSVVTNKKPGLVPGFFWGLYCPTTVATMSFNFSSEAQTIAYAITE